MIRLALIPLAILMMLLGLIIFSSPLPFGGALMLAGCALLVSVSQTAAFRLRQWRLSSPRFNNLFTSLELRAPGVLGRALRRTTP